jgi:hypothetical protein
MKKYYFILLISIASLFNSCIHDFEEGNDFSFRTFNQRLINQWKLEGIWINGIDSTNYYPYKDYTNPSNFRMILFRNYSANGDYRNFEFNRGNNGYQTGMWDFVPKKNEISFVNGYGFGIFNKVAGVETAKVICCKNSRLIFESTLNETSQRKVRFLYIAL